MSIKIPLFAGRSAGRPSRIVVGSDLKKIMLSGLDPGTWDRINKDIASGSQEMLRTWKGSRPIIRPGAICAPGGDAPTSESIIGLSYLGGFDADHGIQSSEHQAEVVEMLSKQRGCWMVFPSASYPWRDAVALLNGKRVPGDDDYKCAWGLAFLCYSDLSQLPDDLTALEMAAFYSEHFLPSLMESFPEPVRSIMDVKKNSDAIHPRYIPCGLSEVKDLVVIHDEPESALPPEFVHDWKRGEAKIVAVPASSRGGPVARAGTTPRMSSAEIELVIEQWRRGLFPVVDSEGKAPKELGRAILWFMNRIPHPHLIDHFVPEIERRINEHEDKDFRKGRKGAIKKLRSEVKLARRKWKETGPWPEKGKKKWGKKECGRLRNPWAVRSLCEYIGPGRYDFQTNLVSNAFEIREPSGWRVVNDKTDAPLLQQLAGGVPTWESALAEICSRRRINPAEDYFQGMMATAGSLEGTPLLDSVGKWCGFQGETPEDVEKLKWVIFYLCVSQYARGMLRTDIKTHTMPVIISPEEGIGKSSFLENGVAVPGDFYTEGFVWTSDEKVLYEGMQRNLLAEWAEFQGLPARITPKTTNLLKAVITARRHNFRFAWARQTGGWISTQLCATGNDVGMIPPVLVQSRRVVAPVVVPTGVWHEDYEAKLRGIQPALMAESLWMLSQGIGTLPPEGMYIKPDDDVSGGDREAAAWGDAYLEIVNLMNDKKRVLTVEELNSCLEIPAKHHGTTTHDIRAKITQITKSEWMLKGVWIYFRDGEERSLRTVLWNRQDMASHSKIWNGGGGWPKGWRPKSWVSPVCEELSV